MVRAGVVAAAVLAALLTWLLWRLDAGPLPLPALDRTLASAIAAFAPALDVRIGAAALVRAGRGVALEVGDVRITGADGAPILEMPHVRVRPSLGALLRGRFVVARIDVGGVAVDLTRHNDGAWTLGGAAGLRLGSGDGASATGAAVPLPRIAFTDSRVRIDDRRSGGTITLSEADLVVSPGTDGVAATLTAVLDLESDVPPLRGRLHLPVRGELGAERRADGAPGDVRFAVAGGDGTLALAGGAGPPLPFAGLAVDGRYRARHEILALDRITARLDRSHLEARAQVRLDDAPTLAIAGTVDALGLDRLTRLWPVDVAAPARDWVAASLRAGELRDCRVRFGAPLSSLDTAPAAASAPPADAAELAVPLEVACDFAGVTADYLPPLAPLRAAAGSARLTAERLVVDVREGAVGACRVDGGTLAMDLAVDPAQATIAADVSGATADVLALVGKPPLAFTPPLGIAPAAVGGTSRVHAELRLPIATTVVPADVAVQATAALADVSLPPLAAGIGISGGRFDVRVDGTTRVEIQGTTAVTGTPLLSRPVDLALTVVAGATAGARSVVFAVAGAEVDARGNASVTGDGLAALALERLRLAGSDVAGTLRRTPDGGLRASLTGTSLDAGRLFAGGAALPEGTPLFAGPFSVAVNVASLRTASGHELRDVRGTIAGRGGAVTVVALDAGLVPDGTVRVSLQDGSAPRRVSVTSDRAGQVLAAIAGLPQIVGGALALEATTDARGPLAALEGTLVLRDFRIVRAPVLAQILSIGSLGGIAALAQGEGLPIREARVPFRWDGSRLIVAEVRAVGAVGLTADGELDHAAGTCDVRGNVIPAYSLNSALGKVPFLGRFLVGGEGEGVFGIDYRVHGRTADPTVSVNPLTSVAPTVLRAWFVDPFTRSAGAAWRRGRGQ